MFVIADVVPHFCTRLFLLYYKQSWRDQDYYVRYKQKAHIWQLKHSDTPTTYCPMDNHTKPRNTDDNARIQIVAWKAIFM